MGARESGRDKATVRVLAASRSVSAVRRAHLVVVTEKGRGAYDAAMRFQAPWADRLSEGLSMEDIEAARRVVAALRKKLEAHGRMGVPAAPDASNRGSP